VLDAQFSADGRYILVRDFMCARMWDINMPSHPIVVQQIHPHFEEHMSTLADCEAIFDQFGVAMHPNGQHFVTGSYDNCFFIHNRREQSSLLIRTSDDRRAPDIVSSYPRNNSIKSKQSGEGTPLVAGLSGGMQNSGVLDPLQGRRMNEDVLRNKVLRVAWHPQLQAVAVAGLYKLYLYQGQQHPSL
jgi:serine/threonine-protein phosphatase 2A regulatory subunit B